MISPRSNATPLGVAFQFRSASRVAILGLCLPAVLGLAGPAHGTGGLSSGESNHEKPYAIIFGTVWGPDDRPVYGVKIRLRRENEKKVRWELYSDHNGEFAIRVPAGKQDYVLWADVAGRKSSNGHELRVTEVKVHVDGDERVDTGLHLK